MNKFTLVLNAGRSGSTFLEQILRANFSDQCYIAHEDIPVQVSKPRVYNRAYDKERLDEILSDSHLMSYVEKWKERLNVGPVIETGWTSYHLCPLFKDVFQDQFQIVVMHRDPISFAFSRASMGNYHKNTFYDDSHEVSPFDTHSIAPQKKDLWHQMNHFEKCMYWWWVIYLEGEEFLSLNSTVPRMYVKSEEVFNFSAMDDILSFIGLDPSRLKVKDVNQNPLAQFVRETFPIEEEWRKYKRHQDILDFASVFGGYFSDDDMVENMAVKYRLPSGLGPHLRHTFRYWVYKRKLVDLIARK